MKTISVHGEKGEKMRLIDADQVVKAVHDEFDECLVWDESGETTANEFENIILQIPTVDPVKHGEWIPCSERLPDKEGRYLCTVGAEFHPVREMIYKPDEFISEADRNIWRSIDGLHVFNWFVKAWMPMPKPYKMDEVEE